MTASFIFYLFTFTALAALAFAGYQVFRTNQSQEKHGDDKKALTHRHDRQMDAVEKARADESSSNDKPATGTAEANISGSAASHTTSTEQRAPDANGSPEPGERPEDKRDTPADQRSHAHAAHG